jgi:GTPase SAR1 family protein
MEKYDYLFKLLLCGNIEVGKSSLLMRYTVNNNNNNLKDD